MLQKSSSSEEVAAIEGSVFWKSTSFKKKALQKKADNAEIDFLKNQFFPKCSFSENFDAVQKYLLWQSSSFLDIFTLNSSSEKSSFSEK